MESKFTPPEALGLSKNEMIVNNVLKADPILRKQIIDTYNFKRANL